MNNLGKVKLLPAREQVASILRKAILSRELQEGQEITLEGIAELVGVSTTPVREAFQILARDGLIKLRPNKGAVVQGINEKTIRDHYETRAVLEGEAAARASAASSTATISTAEGPAAAGAPVVARAAGVHRSAPSKAARKRKSFRLMPGHLLSNTRRRTRA